MKDIRENSIKKIILTDIFFSSCDKEKKKIIDIINNLNIKENYEYPKDIIIHNIISNIFNKKEITTNYCEIIIHIIEQLLNIKLPVNNTLQVNNTLTQNIEYTLKFILKKILYFGNPEKNTCLKQIKDDIDNIIKKKVDKKTNNAKKEEKSVWNYFKSPFTSKKVNAPQKKNNSSSTKNLLTVNKIEIVNGARVISI